MPKASPVNLDAIFNPPDSFCERTSVNPIHGFPPFKQPNTQSLAWVRENSGRAMDAMQLTYLSDVYPPRIWYIGDTPRPFSTITLSVYFHSTANEIAAIGDNFILSEAIGSRAEHSTVGSRLRIWSESGSLLASSEQLAWFK